MMLSARIALPLLSMLMAIISASSSADLEYDYRYGSESEISKVTSMSISAVAGGKTTQIPVGFLSLQNAVLESSSDYNYSRNIFDPGNYNQFGVSLPAEVGSQAVALDALGDFMYFQAKDPATGKFSLERCTLVGCSVLKDNAADPRAVQMGLPSHTLNPQGIIFTWYQNQATSPRTNQLSFFDLANTEHKVLEGDGYVTAISRPVNPSVGINGLASLQGKPILAKFKNSEVQWWPIESLSATELVPVAIDGNDNPRIILLEKNSSYAGSIFACDIDWSLNLSDELKCIDGLKDLGIKADFNLGWYLDDKGLLYANNVLFDDASPSVDGALINTNKQEYIRFKSVGVPIWAGSQIHYFYTTIYGDIVFREQRSYGSLFSMFEVDKNGDDLGDAWTEVYPATLDRPNFDEDSDGLSNRIEYHFGSNPLKKDTDRDGVDDNIERDYGSNPNDRDSDNDYLNDVVEIANGTNPNNPDSDGDGYKDGVDDFPLDPDQFEDYNTDGDGDGIPDYIEDKTWGISSNIADSHLDLDEDGLTNLQEYNLTTSINNSDSDGDQLPDGYEVTQQFNPLSPEEGVIDADYDQDGWSNIFEYQAQTSPRDELEFPQKGMLKWTASGIKDANAVSAAAPDGTIYIPTHNNKIYSVAPDSTVNWEIRTQIRRLTPVVGADGTVYIPDQYELKALNPDGTVKWSRSGSWYVATGEHNGVYIASSNERTLIYINSLGDEVWKTTTAVGSKPIVGLENIYLLTNVGLSAFSKQGQLQWSYENGVTQYLAIDMYDQSIVTVVNRELKRISNKGELIASKVMSDHFYSPSIRIDNNRNVYLFDSYNRQYSYDLDFSLRWKKTIYASLEAFVLDGLGQIYVQSRGKLQLLDTQGELLWEVDASANGLPLLVSENSILVGAMNYQIPKIINSNNYWGHQGKNSGNTNSACSTNDLDCDGLPILYEELHGFNSNVAEGGLDRDRDGLTNYQEYLLGSDPSFNDTDGDQIPDAYEVNYSLNILSNDAAEDLDSDGYDNLTEYNEGTNPGDKLSTPEQVEGQLRWEIDSLFEGMTADDAGTIYGFENNKVYAVDYRGEVKWEVESSPLRQPLALFSESKLLIVNQEGLRFLNTETGEKIISVDGYFTKVAKEQNGFIAAKAYPHSLIKYDLDANEIWSADVTYLIAQLAVNSNGVIYIGGATDTVSAYSSMGEALWQRNVGGNPISPFAIDSLGNLVFSNKMYLYSLTESNEFNWSSIGGDPKWNLAPVIDGKDSVYFIQTASGRFFLTEVDSAGQQVGGYLLPGLPGQIQLDASGSIIVSFKNELRIYSDGVERVINLREDNYRNTPMEFVLTKDRLVVALKNQDNILPIIKNIYYANSLQSIGWSSYGGGTHNVNSVCALVDSDCDGLSDSMELSLGLDPDLKDTHWDKDQDGIINIRELQLGLNPTSADSDGDGLEDNFELLNGLDPLFDDANDDADQDGYSNLVEYQAGSDINDASATALLEAGVKQWEKTVSSRNFIVGPDSTSYVIEGDDVIAYSIKGFELWRNLAPNQYRNRSRGMMLANTEHLAILSQYQLVVYDVITGEQLWKVDGSFDTFAANGSGQIYLSSNQGLFLYDLSGSIVRQLDSNSPHNQLIVDKDGGYYFTPSRSVYAYDVQGNRIWTKSYSQVPQSLMLDPAGDIRFIISGELYKLDPNGNEKWRRKPSYPNSSNYRSVIGLNGTSYLYGSNYTMVAIDEDGKELWNKSIGYSIDSDLSIDKDNSIKFLSNSKLISVDSKGISSELTLGTSYSPYSLTITDEQLFVSDGNKISKLYSDQKGLAFSWATKGAGNHHRNSPCGLIDDDCDGLPNSYEIEVGLNPQLHDILNDADGDGLNNITELGLGSDMFARDTDSDGMPDKYEYTFGLDLLSHDAFEDADADGFTNFDEYSVKSDPNDPLSTALKENGAQQWSHSGQYKESAVDNEQNSYVVQGSTLFKFDKFGSKLWQVDVNYSDTSLLPVIVDESLLIIQNAMRNYIQAYDAKTGMLLWTKNANSAVVTINKHGEIFVRNSYDIEKLSRSGTVEWSKRISGYKLLVNLDDELVSASNRTLYVYSRFGELNWSVELTENISNFSIDLNGDYYLTHSRAVSKVNRFGQLLWTKQVGNSPTIPLIDFNSNFYTKTDNYDVKKFDLNGNLIWSSRLAANATGEMTLAGDGKLYVPHYQSISIISADGTVEALSIPNQRSIFSVKPIEQSLFIASELSYRRVFNNGSKAGSVWSSKFGGLHNKGIIYNHDDLDGDGLSDSFEQSVGLDHTRKDTLLDADNDGVNNITELQLGLDLFNIDSDLDGMKDGYEVSFGLNPKVNDASLDLDQDGYSNLQEFIAGSIPNDASSIASSDIGSKRWITNLGYTQFALGAGGKVFAWSNHILYGLDQYGREMWQTPIRSLNQDPISLPDNKVILLDDDNLSLLDGNSGAILWQVTGGDYYHALLGKNRNIYALDRNRYLVSFDLSGQKVLSTTRRYDSLVRQADGTILGTDGNDIYQIDEYGVRFGERSRGRDDFAPLALTLDSSVIGSVNNYLHKFSSSGYELWRFDAERHSSETELYSPLVDSLGNSYTLFDDILIAVDPFGSEWWRIDVSDAKGAPVLAADGRIFIPGQQKVLVITANLSSSSVGGIKTTIPMPDLRYHYKIQVVGDQLLVAGRNQLESIYIGNASENTSLVGWTSTLGGSHNGSMICGLEDFDCEPSPNNSLPNSSNDFSSDSNQ